MKKYIALSLVIASLLLMVSCSFGGKKKDNNDEKNGSAESQQAKTDAPDPRKSAEEEYKNLISQKTAERILNIYCDDFNSDGIFEAYAVTTTKPVPEQNDTSAPEKSKGTDFNVDTLTAVENTTDDIDKADHGDRMSVWFASKGEAVRILEGDLSYNANIWSFSDKKLFAMDKYDSGFPCTVVYFVSGDKAYSYGDFGVRIVKDNDDPNVFYALDYAGGERTTPLPYYLYFDGNFFCEYGAIALEKEVFNILAGAEEIVVSLENGGYTVNDILYRDNGVININITKESANNAPTTDNVTLLCVDGRVSLVPAGSVEDPLANSARVYLSETVISNKFDDSSEFSYGGSYSASIIPSIAQYPNGAPAE